MGDLNRNPPSFSPLPPGCRFHPSEEQLLRYYLVPKANNDRRFGFDLIKDVDLYRYDPFDLPDTACFLFGPGGSRRHWYCYVAVREGRALGRRKAGAGYWRKRGKERDVLGTGAGKVVLGTRKSFVFYLGDSAKTAVRTDWIMYEYALIDHHEVSFVLCRVVVKLGRRCNGSDHVLNSCGEGSFVTVRDIGIQHDGNKTSSIRETVLQDDDSVDKDEELRVKFSAQEVAVAGVDVQPCEPVSASERTRDIGVHFVLDNFPGQHLTSVLEEDYIELYDLSILEEDYIELDDLSILEEDYIDLDDLSVLEEDYMELDDLSILEEDYVELDDLTPPLLGIDLT